MRSEPIQNRSLNQPSRLPVPPTDLMVSLTRLVNDLLIERKAPDHGLSSVGMDLRWEDEQNIYLEIPVNLKSPQEIDICIVEGKAYIRLDR